MIIIGIENSPKKNKRYRVLLDNNKHYDFGLKNGNTYIDHNDKIKRLNYWNRHFSNKKEYELISNLIESPSLFSSYLLWGKYNNLDKNINYLNHLWKQKYS
jgi:hypothetical protein